MTSFYTVKQIEEMVGQRVVEIWHRKRHLVIVFASGIRFIIKNF